MNARIATSIFLLTICSSGADAATWKAEAELFTPGLGLSGARGTAKIEDGTFTSATDPGVFANRSSDGTVKVESAYSDRASASLEQGRLELVGFAPGGATTAAHIFDTLNNFKTRGGPFYIGYQIEYAVEPFMGANYGNLPIGSLSFSIQGGGTSSAFDMEIFGCPFVNECRTTDLVRFPNDTSSITISMSMSAALDGIFPLAHDYYAQLRLSVVEVCLDEEYLPCPIPFDTASGKRPPPLLPLPALVPVPPAVVLLGSALAGLAGLARRRKTAVLKVG